MCECIYVYPHAHTTHVQYIYCMRLLQKLHILGTKLRILIFKERNYTTEILKHVGISGDEMAFVSFQLKGDLQELGLSKLKTRMGLEQLMIKPYVVLSRLSVSRCG